MGVGVAHCMALAYGFLVGLVNLVSRVVSGKDSGGDCGWLFPGGEGRDRETIPNATLSPVE